jgi:Domain of unknown function (DUF4412)
MCNESLNNTFLKTILCSALSCIVVATASCAKSDAPSNSSTATPSTSSSPSSTGGDFEGAIAMKMQFESEKQMEMTYFLKGRHTRIETRVPGTPEGSAVMLWDLDAGKWITMMPARKMYMTLDLKETAESMKESARDKMGGDDEKFPKLTATGKQETIAGHTCEHWLMGDQQEIDMCVAKGLGYFGMGGQSGSGLGTWKNMVFSPKLLAEAATHPEWVKFLEGGAFPLKLTTSEGGKVKMNMEATSVEKKPLDDSLFTVPSDYKELNVPSLPGGKR